MDAVIWFRRDLRLHDNPALAAARLHAGQHGGRLRALFIETPQQWREHDMAPRQADLLCRRLNALGSELAQLGVQLELLSVPDFTGVPAVLGQWLEQHPQVSALFANRELPIDEVRRDQAVTAALAGRGIGCHWFDERCLFVPGSITTDSGTQFQIFTPYSRRWLRRLEEQGITLTPVPEACGEPLAWQEIAIDYPRLDSSDWPVSEQAVRERLWQFAQQKLVDYGEQRDFPAVAGTSQISPYLALGVLSVRQCLKAIEAALPRMPLDRGMPGFVWLNELIWREFYQHMIAMMPVLAMGRSYKSMFDKVPWHQDEQRFAAWCEGRTGYPIVDAAMRCLNQTGWMHNRLRMIVASFLTKDLHLPWRWGERYFMQTLIDGELAANNGGWQWSAGCGADAAPWFRIFNPATQSAKFDPKGDFIRRYLPELATVPDKQIHAPHKYLASKGMTECYVAPMVDHGVEREVTLALFRTVQPPKDVAAGDAVSGN